jgi:hypothetical protein
MDHLQRIVSIEERNQRIRERILQLEERKEKLRQFQEQILDRSRSVTSSVLSGAYYSKTTGSTS